MNTLLEIERAISALSPNELNQLYTWMDQNSPIDVQLRPISKRGTSTTASPALWPITGPETPSNSDARDDPPR